MIRAQMKAAHKKQIECRQAALPHLRPPGERVRNSLSRQELAGILRKPAGIDKPPVVVMAVGLDSTKEETDAYEMPFLARGLATLVFEGPGQGEAQYDFPIRGDYEVPVKAVLDYVETRAISTASASACGASASAAITRRARRPSRSASRPASRSADRSTSAPPSTRLPELTRETFRVRSHCKTVEEARKNAQTLSLVGVAQNITCPIFIVNGRLDRVVPAADAERLAREVKGPVVLMMIEDGNHIANNRAYRWRSQSADWMKEQLG